MKCGYCGRNFAPHDSRQKYCCSSCKNCASSSRRLDDKDLKQFRNITSYYATEDGLGEVQRGLHDDTLSMIDMTRDEWVAKWKERNRWGAK